MNDITNSLEWHTPDTRWEVFGAPNYETYLQKYMVKGLFHSGVPEDIIKEYQTVEYLLAHAYYYYPMYDEGFNKLLRTLELAVKLRCQQLEIPVGKKNLQTLMKFVQQSEPDKPLEYHLNKGRKLRNFYSHPNSHTYAGPSSYTSFFQMVNTINSLFIPEQHFSKAKKKLSQWEENLNSFLNGSFVLDKGEKRYLIHSFKIMEYFQTDRDELFFCIAYPVIIDFKKSLEQGNYPPPFMLGMRNLNIENEIITGTDVKTGELIQISISKNEKDYASVNSFLTELRNAPKDQLDRFFYLFNYESAKEVTFFRYWNYWDAIKTEVETIKVE